MSNQENEEKHKKGEEKPSEPVNENKIIENAEVKHELKDNEIINTDLIEVNIEEFDTLSHKTRHYTKITEKEKAEVKLKIEYLLLQIEISLKDFERKKKRNRRPALIFKVLIASLSSVVTILLGIRIDEHFVKYLDQIALIFSALMSVVATWNAFYDYNALWVQFTKTVSQLRLLQKDVEYLRIGNNDITVSEVNYMKERFDEILSEAIKLVIRVRSEDVNEGKK